LLRTVLCIGLALGCSDLTTLSANHCGNHVIEPPEDCDGFADPLPGGPGTRCLPPGHALAECRYACDSKAQVCPAGWGCGKDGLCRQATGQYQEAPSSPYDIDGDNVYAADVDGDEALDLMGASFGDLWIQFGSDGAAFRSGLVVPLVDIVPSPSFADVNADGRTDAIVGSGLGFATLLGQEDRDLVPLAYPAFDVPSELGDTVAYFPIRASAKRPFDDLVVISEKAGTLTLELVGLGNGSLAPAPPTTVPALDLSGRLPGGDGEVVIANVDSDPLADEEELAVALSGQESVWIYAPTIDDLGRVGLAERAVVPLPAKISYLGARFLDLDGDGALDLVVETDDGMVVAEGQGDGRFLPAHLEARFDHRRVLATSDLDGDGRLDYVHSLGVLTTLADGTLEERATPFVYWQSAQVADLNRDGRLDIAGIGYDQGFDVLLSDAHGFFTYGRVATTGHPKQIRTGDFDGDGVADVALHEEEGGRAIVSVAFGNLQGLPKTPVVMGRWDEVQRMEPMSGDRYRRDGVDDLMVQSRKGDLVGGNLHSVTVMSGTVQRRMVSPFELDSFIDFVRVGHFDGGLDEVPDALAITAQTFHIIRGAGEGLFYPSDVRTLSVPTWELSSYCSVVTTGDLDDDRVRVDEVLALDGCGAEDLPLVLRVARIEGSEAEPRLEEEGHTLEGHTASYEDKLTLADVGLDPRPEVIVTMGGQANEDYTAYVGNAVIVYWNRQGQLEGDDTLEITDPARRVYAARPIHADGDAEAELAVLTDEGVEIVEIASPTLQGKPVVSLGFEIPRDLKVVDLDQDGLEDLVVKGLDRLHVFVAIPRRP
jgi:hypothetical protein